MMTLCWLLSNSHNIHCAKLDLRWKCWDKESGKHCVRKKIPTTYSCQWWKEAPTNCNCRLYDHSCIAKCANKPREMYICFGLSENQCKGSIGQMRWCSWLPNLISETNSCNTYTSESSCNNDSMCNRGFSSLREEFESHNSLKRAVCMEWNNIVDDSICEENNIPNPCGNTNLDWITTCPSGQHFENRSCESNTKTVACDATWIATTENGKTVNRAKQVQVTRSDITHSWSRPAKCDFTCATGYEERGNQCVKSRPPRHIVAVKCDANVGDLTYDGWSKSLSTLYSVHDGYYAEFSSIPSQLELQVYCKYGNLNMSLIHWDMDEKSIRNELGLTDNDNIKIYKCYWNAHRLCNVSYWDPL